MGRYGWDGEGGREASRGVSASAVGEGEGMVEWLRSVEDRFEAALALEESDVLAGRGRGGGLEEDVCDARCVRAAFWNRNSAFLSRRIGEGWAVIDAVTDVMLSIAMLCNAMLHRCIDRTSAPPLPSPLLLRNRTAALRKSPSQIRH